MFNFCKKRKSKQNINEITSRVETKVTEEQEKIDQGEVTKEGKKAIQDLLFYFFYKYIEERPEGEQLDGIIKKINKDDKLKENEEVQTVLGEIEKIVNEETIDKSELQKLWFKLQGINFSIVLNRNK